MTDTHLDALLLAVLADPNDDGPRLIYADAIDEAGECDRAEFIRVQVELARLGDDGGPIAHDIGDQCGCYLCVLRRRGRELLDGERDYEWFFPQWLFPRGAFALEGHWAWGFRRGFVDEVRCPLADWLKYGPEVVRRQPVERVRVTGVRPWNADNRRWGWSKDHHEMRSVMWNADNRRWGWSKDHHEMRSVMWVIPSSFFDLLDKADAVPPSDQFSHRVWYGSEEMAVTRLNRACLLYARREAFP